MAEKEDSGEVIIVLLAIAVLVVVVLVHFYVGRTALHAVLVVIALCVVAASKSHFDTLEKAETQRVEAEKKKLEQQQKEKQETIKSAAQEKVFSYLGDLRRASTRIANKPESMPNITMAMDEILDRIITDTEITDDVFSDKKVTTQVTLVRDLLVDVGMENSHIIKRIDSLTNDA